MNWKGKVIAEKLTDIKNTGAVGFFWNLEFHLLLKKKNWKFGEGTNRGVKTLL